MNLKNLLLASPNSVKWLFSLFSLTLFFLISLGLVRFSAAQDQLPADLTNGSMETWSSDSQPEGWNFSAPKGGSLSKETDDVFAGENAALIETTESSSGNRKFANLAMQINGRPLRGKTVRFRAAVRTDGGGGDDRAQLWFRVDRESDTYLVGAFDNMQARPITSDQWKHYDIVLNMDADADKIMIGILTFGKCKTWFDDASLEIVDDDTPTTDMYVGAAVNSSSQDNKKKNSNAARRGMSPILMKALADAENAPRQAFFTPWLWLVAIALALFAISGLPCGPVTKQPEGESLLTQSESRSKLRFIPKFALRFSVAYWVLYSFPIPLGSLIPKYGYVFQSWYRSKSTEVVNWVAANAFKIQGELVPPNGSGDTTFSYIQVFTYFVLALAIAGLWSLIDWRKTNYRITKDVLRSYLRYVLAFWMLTYGLGKVSWGSNQFPLISEYQFNKRWGDSSPMNVVWSFMGSSRAYTIFAGLGEVVGGLLIVWRRTATLGALVVFGVMLNVVMLNFCYDVPVKLFSVHLLIMALYVLLPDVKRLTNILIFNRPTEKAELRPPYTGPVTIWIHRAVKLAILVMLVGIPVYKHVDTEARYLADQADMPDYFGQYEVEEFKLDGKVDDQSDSEHGWRSVRFLRQNEFTMQGVVSKNKLTIGFNQAIGRADASFTDEDSDLTLELEEHSNQVIPQETIVLQQLDEDRLLLSGKTALGNVEVTLRRNDNIYRVKDRGYRWINEVPFNR